MSLCFLNSVICVTDVASKEWPFAWSVLQEFLIHIFVPNDALSMQAYDLGLHRGSDKWKIGNKPLFTPEELQARKQLWWACNRADK